MGTSDVFQVLKTARAEGECNLRTWKPSRVTIIISQNAQVVKQFFIYNILNKMIKRKEENATVTLLWTSNSVMALNQTAHVVYLSCNCDEKSNPKIVLSFTTKQKVLFKLKTQ